MSLKFFKVYDFQLDGHEPQGVNTARTISVDGTLITLVRLPDAYFALANKCPHAGANLGHGQCTPEGKIVCPAHRYQYDVKTGKGQANQGDFVKTYPVELREEGVFVGLDLRWWKVL